MLIDPLPTFASATSRSACKVWEIALIVLPRGIRLQRHELPAFTCLPSCLQAKAAIFNCFLQSLDEVQSGDANRPHRPHPICSASQPTNNMVFLSHHGKSKPWRSTDWTTASVTKGSKGGATVLRSFKTWKKKAIRPINVTTTVTAMRQHDPASSSPSELSSLSRAE